MEYRKNLDNKDSAPAEFLCPKCGNKGAKVGAITPKSLLNGSSLQRFDEERAYRFCKSPKCSAVYFSNSASSVFTKDDLRVKVTVKESSLDVPICYCFGYSRQSILDEMKKNGGSKAVKEISAKMKDPGCFCETSNPEGRCCLKNVDGWIKKAGKIADFEPVNDSVFDSHSDGTF